MATVTSYFDDFLENIRLTKDLRDDCQEAHITLRARLMADEDLKPTIVSTFLQGSYRRNTGTRPLGDDHHVDVDVVVVTNLNPHKWTPDRVVALFTPFLQKWYPGQWERNDRSMKISPTGKEITMDLVVTAAPSEIQIEAFQWIDPDWTMEARGETERRPVLFREAFESLQKAAGLAEWQREPLLIPARDLQTWVPTHPLEQIRWTSEKNGATGGHYINVVKAIKWWRKRHGAGVYPKGYPLEHLVGETCPNGIESVAEGVARAFEAIRDRYESYARTGLVPELRDRGVDQNVFRRIEPEQFRAFWNETQAAAGAARLALDAHTAVESGKRWRDLLGNEFPMPDEPFTPPADAAKARAGGRFG
jgi:hypothetical protein